MPVLGRLSHCTLNPFIHWHHAAPTDSPLLYSSLPRLTAHLQEHDVDAKPFHKKVGGQCIHPGGGETRMGVTMSRQHHQP